MCVFLCVTTNFLDFCGGFQISRMEATAATHSLASNASQAPSIPSLHSQGPTPTSAMQMSKAPSQNEEAPKVDKYAALPKKSAPHMLLNRRKVKLSKIFGKRRRTNQHNKNKQL